MVHEQCGMLGNTFKNWHHCVYKLWHCYYTYERIKQGLNTKYQTIWRNITSF
jgi:hypothetical protein